MSVSPKRGAVVAHGPSAVPRPSHGSHNRHMLANLVRYAIILPLSALFIVPWVWMISTSLKSPAELAIWPPVWIPNPIRWDNYLLALQQAPFLRYLLNTLTIAIPSVIGAVVSNALVAYGFARVRWPGRDTVFALVLATLMLPGFVTFIPLYVTFRQLNWIDTYLPLVVPTFLGNAFFIFLLRQFLMRIPEELSDAARVDGASEWRIFVRIILPLAKPALAVVALFQFLGSWNDYFGPLIYVNDQSKYTIALGIANMQSSYGFSNFAWIMAATCMSVLPIIVLFFFAQRTFIEGIALTGLKG
jgi:multiple sugar transport system permease protein